MTEIEAIQLRHSVRAYQNRKIEQEKVDQLKAIIDMANREGNLHLQFVEDAGKTFKRILSKVDLGIVKYHFTVGAEFKKNGGANIE